MTRIWFALGLNDIVARYRGSVLGPFWITLTTAVFVAGIGVLYADLMHVSVEKYLPWMATGVVVWGFINQATLESADSFMTASHVLRQTAIPLPLFICRVLWRNVLTFAHQTPVLLIVALKFHYLFHINPFALALGLALNLANISWFGLCAAIVCARYRDLQQVLGSIMQMLFFLSPVMWIPSESAGYNKILNLLPTVHMLNVMRGPLIGEDFHLFGAAYLALAAVLGWIFTLLFFSTVRRRIVHYV